MVRPRRTVVPTARGRTMGRRRDSGAEPTERTCGSCGRRIEWRARWADDWDEVRWCSAACRRRKVRPVDRSLERHVLRLLDGRARGATICPSEAARAQALQDGAEPADGDAWRALMEPARRAARRLVAAGEVEITQRGQVVDPSTAKGPIRVRRASR